MVGLRLGEDRVDAERMRKALTSPRAVRVVKSAKRQERGRHMSGRQPNEGLRRLLRAGARPRPGQAPGSPCPANRRRKRGAGGPVGIVRSRGCWGIRAASHSRFSQLRGSP